MPPLAIQGISEECGSLSLSIERTVQANKVRGSLSLSISLLCCLKICYNNIQQRGLGITHGYGLRRD